MGTALRKLKKGGGAKDDNGMPVKFKGRLTDNSIKALNVYYGGAIRNNTGSIDGMMNDIDASFLHSMSTDTYSVHTKCPKHEPPDNPSWCKFNTTMPKHKHKHPPLIPLIWHGISSLFINAWLTGICLKGAVHLGCHPESKRKTIWISCKQNPVFKLLNFLLT